jgi:hypothetical protein
MLRSFLGSCDPPVNEAVHPKREGIAAIEKRVRLLQASTATKFVAGQVKFDIKSGSVLKIKHGIRKA